MPRPDRFASDTRVPIEQTQMQINKLLRAWGCGAIGWYSSVDGKHALDFTFKGDGGKGTEYRCRVIIKVPDKDAAGRTRTALSREQWERSAFRLLLMKLKADMNAARDGFARAEEIFLPWILDRQGRTVAEILIPQLPTAYAALPPKGGTS